MFTSTRFTSFSPVLILSLWAPAEYEVFKAQRCLRKFRNNNKTEKQIIHALKRSIQQDDHSGLADLYRQLKAKGEYEEICFWLEKNSLV